MRNSFNSNKIFHTGAVVLRHEDNLSSQQWRLGRLDSIHLGKGDVIRVVTVKTNHGVFKRSVLPTENKI